MTNLSTSTFTNLTTALGSRASAKEIETYLHVENVLKFGADPTGEAYSDDAFRKATDAIHAVGGGLLEIPAGHYKFIDTWEVCNPDTGWRSIHVRGAGGYAPDPTLWATKLDFSDMTPDRCAIVIQGARNVILEGFVLEGCNVKPNEYIGLPITDVEDDWITPNLGITTSQYRPYAGICIDPYSGTDPGGENGYNATYGRSYSAGVTIRDVVVWYFLVGIMNNPSNAGLQCEYLAIENTVCRANTYGYSVGAHQARTCTFTNFVVEISLTAYVGCLHGTQTGCCPNLHGGGGVLCYNVFDFPSGYNCISATDIYFESIRTIGYLGKGTTSITYAASFKGCGFRFDQVYEPENQHPFHVGVFMPTVFDGCYFGTKYGVLNVGGGHCNVRFNACNFVCEGTWNDIFYTFRTVDWNRPFVEFSACQWTTTYWASTNVANNTINANGITLPNRIEFHPYSRWFVAPQKNYELVSGGSAFGGANSYMSSSISAYTKGASTLTFTANPGTEFAVGDVIMWETIPIPRASNITFVVPAAVITGIVTNAVTCTYLCDPDWLDATETLADAGYVRICHREYAHGSLVTGDTNSNTSITNVTNAANFFSVGDYIYGTNIPANTRVTVVSGTTVTISKAATGTATGVKLYFGLLRQTATILTGSKTHDFASVANGDSESTTVTVHGAAAGDRAVASLTTAIPAKHVLSAYVTAANTVTVTLSNIGGTPTNHASGTLAVQVFQ